MVTSIRLSRRVLLRSNVARMTSVQTKPTSADETAGSTFDSLDPATDEVVGSYPINTAEDVAEAVARAREAAAKALVPALPKG